MKKSCIVLGALCLLPWMARAWPSYLYWEVDSSDAGFSYARLRLSGGDVYFPVGDTPYTKVGADTEGEATLGRTTSPVSANLGLYASSEYSYFVEVFDENGNLLGFSDAFSFDAVSAGGYVYTDMATAATGEAYGVTVSSLPEPAGGLLLLLGMAGLALRRRKTARANVAGAVSCALCLAFASAFGAANDVVLTFSTPGPDTYRDGTAVLDGESYALVWTKAGCAFGGMTADGKLVSANDRLVLVAGIAEGGRCPTTVFEIDAAAADVYAGGTFSLYLLDTRVKDAGGRVSVSGVGFAAGRTPAAAANGAGLVVNSVGVAAANGADAGAARPGASFNGLIAQGAVSLGKVGVHSKIESPKITALRVENGKVALAVEGMMEAADYFVVPGTAPGKFAPALATRPVDGVFTFDRKDNAPFFKVIGVRKFE